MLILALDTKTNTKIAIKRMLMVETTTKRINC